MKERPAGVYFSGGLGLFCLGLGLANASTYPCDMRDELGVKFTLALGVLTIWFAGMVYGYGIAVLRQRREKRALS